MNSGLIPPPSATPAASVTPPEGEPSEVKSNSAQITADDVPCTHKSKLTALLTAAQEARNKADFTAAESSLTKALDAAECNSSIDQLAESMNVVGEMLASLAERHSAEGDSARAEVLYLRAIQVFRKTLDSDHPLIALSRDNLAGLYKARKQYALAESMQRTALSDLIHYYKGPHADIAVTMCNLADTCLMTGRSVDARALLQDALAMLRQLFGDSDPRVVELSKYYESALCRFNGTPRPHKQAFKNSSAEGLASAI